MSQGQPYGYPPQGPPGPPAPVIMPNHPIDLGEQMGTSLRAYRSRIGSFLLITLMPYLASIVIFGIASLIGVLVMVDMVHKVELLGTATFGVIFGPVVLFLVITLVAAALTGFFTLKSSGMQSVLTRLTIDHADQATQGNQGPKPTFGDAWRGSAGFVLRILPLYLLLLAVVVVVSVAYVGIGLAIMLPSVGSTNTPGDFSRLYGAMFGLVGFSLVLELALAVIYIIVATRLYPLVPVIALERASGITALKRAWALTKGNGLRTFGYMFVAGLIPIGVIYAVAFIGGLAGSGLLSSSISLDATSTPSVGPGLVGGLLVIYLPVIIAAVVVMPFLGIFQTVYTIDLQRREHLGLRPGQRVPQPGYPQQQPYPQQQHPGYPQQQPGYPQPGYQQQPTTQQPPQPPYGPGYGPQ